ncbi:hypothetical protein [uncultured Variovorax sp.]|uniref:hypothetical protein n=1 Tax=uncultured Variovorax sp. TaxID=114708 RepID=UPI00260F01CD|nr:hypothetical protein [uncultured Variovorax sp.]
MGKSKTNVPFAIRQAAAKFRSQRADYYSYIADKMEGGKGDIKMLSLFEKDAQRYGKSPRAKLSQYWAEAYETNGANLAAAWDGTLPDSELAIIEVAQEAGAGALLAALRDVARVARLTDQLRGAVISSLAAGAFGLLLGLVMLTVFPMIAAAKLQEIYSFIPLEEWGPRGTTFNKWGANVRDYGLYVVLVVGVVLFAIYWSVDNLIGPLREWLDEHVVLYRVARDVRGALFLATMSTLTRKRGNTMFTLSAALATFAQSVRSPWLRWRVEEVAEGVARTGALGSEAFNTKLLSQEMYWFLEDMQGARGFAEGFEATGQHVEESMLKRLLKRLTIYRWAMLLAGVACVLCVMAYQAGVIYEMKNTMTNFYSSR